MRLFFVQAAAIAAALFTSSSVDSQSKLVTSDPDFFESRIRPILSEHCYACHSTAAKQPKGGFLLDNRAALIKGGARGPAVIPGNPDTSLLLKAISYADPSLQMPPSGKLPDSKIAAVSEWIKQGAVWPMPKVQPSAAPTDRAPSIVHRPTTDFWSFRPLRKPPIPTVKSKSWSRNPIDNFILSKLETNGLKPASEADKRVWLRRVTYDLIGLPPAPAELEAFMRDISPNAYEKVVDRLLASPHYGERWARHWLDLVRFAETDGHEFDTDKPGAFEYRDYVIRALNADVPYNQFVKEHIAGDLIPKPRINSVEKFNESVIGTGFWWLGEADHSPVDVRENECERFANQIDVFSKAFLGLSAGCARCHDHKFDPIPTRDYYALAGYLRSSRFQLADITPVDSRVGSYRQLERISSAEQSLLGKLIPRRQDDKTQTNEIAGDSTRTKGDPAAGHPTWITFADFAKDDYSNWSVSGEAFGKAPRRTQLVRQSNGGYTLEQPGFADSGVVADALQGELRSKTFTISKPFILYFMGGRKSKLNLIVDGYQKIRDPIYGGLSIQPYFDGPMWYFQDVSKWIGHHAYVELLDQGPGWIALQRVIFADSVAPTPDMSAFLSTTLSSNVASPELEALRIQRERIVAALPPPRRVLSLVDGTGEDEHVLIRGSYRTPGELAPRRLLSVCGGAGQPTPYSGSGRLELADRMVSSNNPLLARVIVNRIWEHHFGEGIVRTPDDFGFMGQRPTHPELLDWLAAAFTATPRQPNSDHAFNWSLKSLHRLIVLSSAYRMSSRQNPAVEKVDPQNKLLHRANVRRLEAECIRDAILAVSGRLDAKMYGPSVAPNLTPFMEGRGRPDNSGPLDGDGRRSIYINVRRNFLAPFFLAFDYPVPFTCMGRRAVSNVPAQALALMNNPFVIQQAGVWAQRVRSDEGASTVERINRMYISAFSRPASQKELASAAAFLNEQDRRYGKQNDSRSWADLCHVLYNVKEFIFID